MSEKLGNIVLVGFMGTGKTAISKEICRILGFPVIDTDHLIEKNEGMTIKEIFSKKGEEYFRDLEHELLKKLAASEYQKSVISTGGGMPVRDSNRQLIKNLGYVVWLKTTEADTYERVSKHNTRPLLATGDLKGNIHTLLQERRPIYDEVSQFDIETHGLTISEIASGIIDSASYYFSSKPA